MSRGLRRGLGGEPLWLAVGVAAWMIRRARRRPPDVVWKGRIDPGERIVVSSWADGVPPSAR